MARKIRSLHTRIVEAEDMASRYLGNANAAREADDWGRVPRLERLCQKWLDEANRLRSMGDPSWQPTARDVRPVFETWEELAPALREHLGQWQMATAWAVGSADPDGVEIRLKNGRVHYEAAWVVFGKRGSEWVRLSRLDPGPHEVVRWVQPDAVLEIRRFTLPKPNDSVFQDTTGR